MTRKQKELINNISQTISKEVKKPNGVIRSLLIHYKRFWIRLPKQHTI